MIPAPRLARWLALAAIALASCGGEPAQPDLGRLYRIGATFSDTTPVIVIPGAFGSKLRDRRSGVEVWPGTARMILFGDYRDLALDFDPETLAVRPDELEAFDITDAALGQDFYGKIIATLRDFGGYVRGTPGVQPGAGERRYYVYAYDWRQDNVESARGLDRACRTASSCSSPATAASPSLRCSPAKPWTRARHRTRTA